MTILSVIREVSAVIGLDIPDAVFTSTDREHVELVALANEMAQRIAFDGRDWSIFKTLATLTGDGTATNFSLPSDYKRMLKKARLWPSDNTYVSLTHYPDTDEWLGMQVQAFNPILGGWTIIGDKIHIMPVVRNAETIKFYYISNLIVKPATGSNKVAFTLDTDTFRLDERVLKLGMIWQWKANKGQPYSEDMINYEAALGVLSGNDQGSKIMVVGRQRMPYDGEFAYPGVIEP